MRLRASNQPALHHFLRLYFPCSNAGAVIPNGGGGGSGTSSVLTFDAVGPTGSLLYNMNSGPTFFEEVNITMQSGTPTNGIHGYVPSGVDLGTLWADPNDHTAVFRAPYNSFVMQCWNLRAPMGLINTLEVYDPTEGAAQPPLIVPAQLIFIGGQP